MDVPRELDSVQTDISTCPLAHTIWIQLIENKAQESDDQGFKQPVS